MCDPNYKRPRSSPNEAVLNSEAVAVANLSSAHRKSTIHLQTAVAIIKTKGNDAPIRIIFDGGSHLTFIKKKVVDELRLQRIDSVRISVACFGETRRATLKWHNVVEVRFKSQFNENTIVLRAVVVEEICSESLSAPLTDDLVIKNFTLSHQLADLNAEYFGVSNEIGMLIGADNYWQIVTGESHKLADNLMALNTKLGWTILGDSGSTRQSDQTITDSNVMLCLHSDTEYDIRNFWNLETLGINVNEKADNMMESFISEKITFKDNRFEVSLPWSTTDSIDSCYNIALAHAKNLTRKLHRQGKLREYDRAIRDYFSNDSAEEANVKPDNDRVYYMPHRPVYREDKDTTKVRIVFNASAHAPDCRSLNDMLLTGDNLMPELLNILLNFRIGRIGIIGDIEKAFLQISVHENDRDALRFLWYRDPIRNEVSSLSDLPPLQSYRMKRVTFGVTSSPFLLNATIRKHLDQQPAEHKDLVNLLIKSFYVDDLILGSNSFEEAVSIFEYARSTMLDAGMNLRKWKTNDVNLSRVFNEAGHDESGGETKKVLGVNWHTSTDELSIDIRPVVEGMNFTLITKRIVLQVIARIFDPLGMLVPFVVRAKLLLQAIWKAKLNWDEELPSKMQHEWKKWCVEIKELTSLTIARCIAPDKNEEYELHIFADASKVAYGAVVYIKSSNKCQPSFVLSKGRIAPINKEHKETLTLPELELTAALYAVRLQDYLISNLSLHIKRVILWSDSKIALHWINGQSLRWKVYVKNRVIEIKKRSKGEWKYCPGKENPADLATRGISSKLLTTSTLWLSGPVWLSCSSEEWPEEESINDSHLSTISCFVEEIDNEYCPFTPIFPLDRYSSILKIHRITAYVQRFCNNLKGDREKAKGPLTTKEIAIAENYWLRFVQGTEYEVEIDALKAKKKVPTHSSIVKLNPKLNDDGLLKLGSRLEESSLPYETIYPIILPKNSVYTERLIWAAHEHTMHGGVNAVLTAIRSRFWIIKGRLKVKSVISKCAKCKRLHGKHGEEPFAPLPRNRITPVRPFEITGVDFAGPLYVKEENGSNKKVYIMLLTCAVVRAVHLELVTDMTAETCVRAFRRFFARRGVPKTIYSDNAMTFKRVSRDLCVLFNSLKTESFQNLAATQQFEWRFIVERAAWWGGFWERMVRSVKTALKITLGKSTVGFDEMHTILLEVEAVVNARPLTYIDEDPANLEILSPAHFLMMGNNMISNVTNPSLQVSQLDILEQWKSKERINNKFWRIWSQQYLQQLRSAHINKATKSIPIKKGDVVLLHDENQPRLMWKLSRVVDVFEGKDGRVRACEIRTSNGRLLRRPIQLLYPLEVDNSPPREDV